MHVTHRLLNKTMIIKLYYTICALFVRFFEGNVLFYTILLVQKCA